MKGELKSIFRGGALLSMESALDIVARFVTLYVFAKLASKEVYGVYTYLQSWFGTLIFLSLPGLSNAIFRSAARGFDGDLTRGISLRLKFSIIASLAFLGLSSYFKFSGKPELVGGLIYAAIFALPLYALADYRSFLHGKMRFGLATLIGGVLAFLRTLLVVFGIFLGFGGASIFGLNLFGQALALALGLFVSFRLRTNKEHDKEFLSFGTVLSGIAILGAISYQVDRLSVGSLLSMNELANYGMAFLLTEPLREFGVVLYRLFFPRLAAKQRANWDLSYLRAVLLAIFALIAAYYPIYLAYQFGVKWLFPRYADALPLVRWLIVAALANIVVMLLETYFQAQDRWLKFYYGFTVSVKVAQMIFTPVAVYLFKVYGAVGSLVTLRFLALAVGSTILFIRGRRAVSLNLDNSNPSG